MKKLPKIFQNDLSKIINNNKSVCYLKNENDKVVENTKIKETKETTHHENNLKEITNILDKIFNGLGYSYNIPLEIKTSDKIYNTSLIAKTNNNVITIDNEIIPINNIIDITIKNNK